MKHANSLDLTAGDIRFEDFVDEPTGDFSADIIFEGVDGDVFVECKSWGGKVPNFSNVPSQMINYFNTQTSLDNFQFQFDPNRWVPTAEDINKGLKENKSLFKTDQPSWDKYETLFGPEVASLDQGDIDGLVDLITTKHFSAIINP